MQWNASNGAVPGLLCKPVLVTWVSELRQLAVGSRPLLLPLPSCCRRAWPSCCTWRTRGATALPLRGRLWPLLPPAAQACHAAAPALRRQSLLLTRSRQQRLTSSSSSSSRQEH